MHNDDVFDKEGIDGKDNQESWDRLAKEWKYFYSSMQKILWEKICKANYAKYGEQGLKDLKKTSGFRSPKVTRRHLGKIDSDHHHAAAIDISKHGLYATNIPAACCNIMVIESKDCWHYQFKRGN